MIILLQFAALVLSILVGITAPPTAANMLLSQKLSSPMWSYSQTAVLGETDEQVPAAHYAAIANLQLEKSDFQTDEDVVATIENQDDADVQIKLLQADGQAVAVHLQKSTHANSTKIQLSASNSLRPGVYTLQVLDRTGTVLTKQLRWGLIALNTQKDVYHSGETGLVQMEVLTERGENDCEAALTLVVMKPNGEREVLTEENNLLKPSPTCRTKDNDGSAAYLSSYHFFEEGVYHFLLTARSENKMYQTTRDVLVQKQQAFTIERNAPSHINPGKEYASTITVKAGRDFNGYVTEVVPESFTVKKSETDQAYTRLETITIDNLSTPQLTFDSSSLDPEKTKLDFPFHGNFAISQGYGTSNTDEILKDFYLHLGLLGHDGVDFALPEGTALYAVDSGEVLFAGQGGYGNTVIIQHPWGKSYYGHLSEVAVTVGMHVFKGTPLGLSGDTGESTGPHLHFSLLPNTPDLHNGYAGMVDPIPFFPPMSANKNKGALSMSQTTAVLGVATGILGASEDTQEGASESAASLSTLEDSPLQTASQSAPVTLEIPVQASSAASLRDEEIHQRLQALYQTKLHTLDSHAQVILWKVNLQQGESVKLGYRFSVPEEKQNYLLGPSMFIDATTGDAAMQTSAWQMTGIDAASSWASDFAYRKKMHIDHTQIRGMDIDTASQAEHGKNVSSISWKQTVNSGANSLLLVGVGAQTSQVASMTYAGVSLTKLRTKECQEDACQTELWYLTNPPEGNNTVTVTMNKADSFVAGSASFTGIDQMHPFAQITTQAGQGKQRQLQLPSDPNQIIITLASDASGGQGDQVGTTLWREENGIGFVGTMQQPLTQTETVPLSFASDTSLWGAIGVVLQGADVLSYPYYLTWESDNRLKNVSESSLQFMAEDGKRSLKSTLDYYDEKTGKLAAWVLLPDVSTMHDTNIYLYYDHRQTEAQK